MCLFAFTTIEIKQGKLASPVMHTKNSHDWLALDFNLSDGVT